MNNILNIQNALNSSILPGTKAHDHMRPKYVSGNQTSFNKDLSKFSKAAILIALFHEGNSLLFPLIERSTDGTVHSGQIAFPGGKMEINETDCDCAIRESHEELGINPRDVEIIGKLSQTPISPSQYIVSPIIGLLKKRPNFSPCSKEVKNYFTISLDEILDNKNIKSKNMPHHNGIYHIPYFELNNKIVWGATAMILYELREILLNQLPSKIINQYIV